MREKGGKKTILRGDRHCPAVRGAETTTGCVASALHLWEGGASMCCPGVYLDNPANLVVNSFSHNWEMDYFHILRSHAFVGV